MAQIVRLTTRQQRSGQEEAAQAAEQLSLLSEELLKHLPGEARLALSKITHALQKAARPDTTEGLWPGGFTMLSRMQTAAIWDAIRALPSDDRPNQVRHAFDLVLLTRDQLAEEIDCAPRSVSTIMGTLEKMGVIRRERRKIEGVRGPGMAVYFINPHVAWNGSLDIRKAQAAETRPPMQLELLHGGAS